MVQSCWTEFSVLNHCARQLSWMCTNPGPLCTHHIEALQQQWRAASFGFQRMEFYGEQPDVHIRIEAFLSGVKTLLDLLAQLPSTEGVLGVTITGIHRDGAVYGGKLLNALTRNVRPDMVEAAQSLKALIVAEKQAWIDGAIRARDQLIHPEKGVFQLMFRLELEQRADALVCTAIHPPEIGSMPAHVYAEQLLGHLALYSSRFVELRRVTAPTESTWADGPTRLTPGTSLSTA